jgi:hypothetical protein
MTGGQTKLNLNVSQADGQSSRMFDLNDLPPLVTPLASEEELNQHQQWLDKHQKDQPGRW